MKTKSNVTWLKKVRDRREARLAVEERRIKDELAWETNRKRAREAWEAMTPEQRESLRAKRRHRGAIGLIGMAALLGGRL